MRGKRWLAYRPTRLLSGDSQHPSSILVHLHVPNTGTPILYLFVEEYGVSVGIRVGALVPPRTVDIQSQLSLEDIESAL